MRKYVFFFLFALLLLAACKVPYNPPSGASNVKYLVVDGFINSGSGPTNIRLSRTTNLADTGFSPELNAEVSVLDDQSISYPLTEQGNGLYSLTQLPADNQREYQLDIFTTDGKEYRSDLSAPKQTPPIDSVNWFMDNNGVHIFVNTHDPLNNTKYYRWGYEETWEIQAAYSSLLKYENEQILFRPSSEQIYECWPADSSTDILVSTTAGLSQDVIYQRPITLVPFGSEKMRIEYSINIYQYAINEGAFDYWQLMKKNTEQLGSLFDAQPSQTPGNIHCVNNPSEPVLGYINVCSVTQSRILINSQQLANWSYTPPYECPAAVLQYVTPDKIVSFFSLNYLYIPITELQGGTIEAGPIECVDCRYRGGTNQKPSYWP